MKITRKQLRGIIREALSTEVPNIYPRRKSSFQVRKEKELAAKRGGPIDPLAAVEEMGYDISQHPTLDSNNMAIDDALEAYAGEFTYKDIIAAVKAAGGITEAIMGMADYPDDVDDAQYDRGYQDGLDGYPPAENATLDYDAGYEQGTNDLRDRMSRPVSEGVLYVSRSQWGTSVESEDDEYISFGDMILDLFKAGDDDIFTGRQGVDPSAKANLLQKHEEGVQGGMQRWDSDVFSDYYNVDLDRVLRLYARLHNHRIEELDEEGLTAAERKELDDDAASELDMMARYS